VTEAMQVKALLYAAAVLRSVDEVEQAEPLVQEALALARQTGDLSGIVFALLNLGVVAAHQDRYTVAQASFKEAAALARQMRDAWNTGIALKNLVDVLLIMGEYERAQALAEECLAIFRAQGAPQQIAESLTLLGWSLFVAQGDTARATSLVEQGLALAREVGPISSTGWALFLLGLMRRHQGELLEARTLLEESLVSGREARDLFQRQTQLARLLAQQGELARARALYQENRAFLPTSGCKYLIADYLEGRGMLETALDVPVAATRLWGAAEVLREAIGAPMYPVDRDEYAQAVAAARTQMSETAFAAAWAEGRALTPEAVLAKVD
jgi:tetratricopeptide (TPR) repeat protein